jgi:rubrerythrin
MKPKRVKGIKYLHCLRCQHDWLPRSEELPKNCPSCNSPYWNKKYQNKGWKQ